MIIGAFVGAMKRPILGMILIAHEAFHLIVGVSDSRIERKKMSG
ncbi:MAG: hypothetical protein WEB37_00965 [Bacteroidota bacterium]